MTAEAAKSRYKPFLNPLKGALASARNRVIRNRLWLDIGVRSGWLMGKLGLADILGTLAPGFLPVKSLIMPM